MQGAEIMKSFWFGTNLGELMQWRIQEFAKGGPVPPIPFLSPFLSLSTLPPFSSPLEVGLLKPARASGGAL